MNSDVTQLSKLKLASINYPDKASLQPEPDNRRAGHSPALRILGAVTQTSPRDFSTGSLDSVRCTKLVSPETADATKLVKLESESKQQVSEPLFAAHQSVCTRARLRRGCRERS